MSVKNTSGKTKDYIKGSTRNQELHSECERNTREEVSFNVCTGNKLVTTKPWFSKSESEKLASDSRNMNLEFASSMASDISPCKNSSTHSSTNIYDTTVNASYALQKTLSVSDSVSGRSMRPRIAEDKNSK